MKTILKRVVTMIGAGVMALSLLAPVTEVSAASKNKVVEVPVNFTNVSWEDLEKCDYNASKTDLNLWNFGEPTAYSESYRVSYKLYVPAAYMKKGTSSLSIWSNLNLDDATEEEWKYGGSLELPGFNFHDGVATQWNEEEQKENPADFVTVKKTGDFYVLTYDATTGALNKDENVQTDITKSEKAAVNFCTGIQGIMINAKNSALYFDDFTVTKADGTVLVSKDFTSDKSVEGDIYIYPVNDWDKESKSIKISTITDNKVLTVKSTKATVKVGKTTKISATATPATKITYTSSNKKVATVNSKGVITGKKAGKATISVKANGKTVKVTVTVKK